MVGLDGEMMNSCILMDLMTQLIVHLFNSRNNLPCTPFVKPWCLAHYTTDCKHVNLIYEREALDHREWPEMAANVVCIYVCLSHFWNAIKLLCDVIAENL